jgi:hypothetical protein
MSRIDNFDFKFNKIKDNPDNRVLLKKLFRLEDELKNIEDNFNIHDITHLFRPNQIRHEKQNILNLLRKESK